MKLAFLVLSLSLASHAEARLKVVTTTADLKAVTEVVVGGFADVTAIAKGSQDPHFVEAKPSYMVKVRDADLVISNGLSLETGWLPTLLRGSRNPKILSGRPGNLDLGASIEPIEKPTGFVTRSMGDVHPEGNPHYMLDPVRVGTVAELIAQRLGELDPTNKAGYLERAKAYQTKLTEKSKQWKARLEKSQVQAVVTYHPSMNYFLSRFGLRVPIHLEAKPGVPPAAQHILSVIETMKAEKIKLVLVDNFFDTKIAERVAKDVPGSKVISVGVAVGSEAGLERSEDVIEQIVKAIEAGR